MVFSLAFIGLIAGLLLWVTLRGRELWPLTSYPMFSERHALAQVEVFRVALETHTGECEWWRSRFYRYPERIGRELQQAQRLGQLNAGLPLLAQRRLLAEAARLIRLEEGGTAQYRALHIVRRTAAFDSQQELRIVEQTIARLAFDDLPAKERRS